MAAIQKLEGLGAKLVRHPTCQDMVQNQASNGQGEIHWTDFPGVGVVVTTSDPDLGARLAELTKRSPEPDQDGKNWSFWVE